MIDIHLVAVAQHVDDQHVRAMLRVVGGQAVEVSSAGKICDAQSPVGEMQIRASAPRARAASTYELNVADTRRARCSVRGARSARRSAARTATRRARHRTRRPVASTAPRRRKPPEVIASISTLTSPEWSRCLCESTIASSSRGLHGGTCESARTSAPGPGST